MNGPTWLTWLEIVLFTFAAGVGPDLFRAWLDPEYYALVERARARRNGGAR